MTSFKIPKDIEKQLKEKIKHTGFDSLESYIIYLLRQALVGQEKKTKVFSQDEEKKVKERLKSLGYLD